MKIKFDSNQRYQLDAINSIVDIFEGQPLAQSTFEIRFEDASTALQMGELGMGNRLVISQPNILANVQKIQSRNEVPVSEELQGMNFSTEMETGTGKTYVYLRTLYELNARYGFKKFVIVVPSVAIREGVMKSIELTKDHFQTLYGNTPSDAWVYDSKQVSRLRQFATSNQMQILVINIDAFNKKDIAVIHQDNDRLSGRKPIEFVQAANPIVIMDEPQNMETDTAKDAIASLNPLCTLRYSATHRNLYNLMYKLNPVKAYDLHLVKQIVVDSVMEKSDFNRPYILVKSIETTSSLPVAKIEIDIAGKDAPIRKTIKITKKGTDLYDLSGEREIYRGYILENIHAGYGYVSFSNGVRLNNGESQGANIDAGMRIQIHQTIENHFEKELAIARLPEDQRMKVLSLFFIDRVSNYADTDGKIRNWFVECYEEMREKPQYQSLNLLPVEQVHNGYFAQDKGKAKDTSGKTRADDDAYALIMKDKERLLSMEEPLRFIFSHSALREGWDNPNVFQICTLNETKSEMKKRQEIGRGLRLPVRMNGERSFDPNINKLTVIANESYREFADKLQAEIEDETGVKFDSGRIKNKRDAEKASLKKGWRLNPEFQELWERIKHRTRYSVSYDSETLIDGVAKLLRDEPPIETPSFVIQTAEARITKEGVNTTVLSVHEEGIQYYSVRIPDMISYLQKETELTRSTIAEILIRSGRLNEVAKNPQQFMDQALKCIRVKLHDLMVDGIKYEKIAGSEYEMMLFEEQEIDGYLDSMLKVDNSIYDYIVYDSDTERKFAEALDKRNDIKLFVKLPSWFKVPTPLGNYNPDWAILKEKDKKLYLVRETKGTKDHFDLRESEWQKIKCGDKHFKELNVDFAWVQSAEQV